MWRAFDAGEIAEDFARIADLALDAVRIFLRWDDFQPAPDVVDPVMLARLETVTGLAAAAGLRVLPTLFCGHWNGVNYLPGWALEKHRSAGRFPTVSGADASPWGAANLYRGSLLDAQVAFARAAGERLRRHPAIVAWDIGNAFTDVREPAGGRISAGEHSPQPVTEFEVAEWSRRLTSTLRDASELPATAGTDAGDLLVDRNLRLGSLCAPFAFASMQGDTTRLPFARNRLDPEAVPFLALMTAAFSFKPVLVTSFGNPTCPRGKFSAFERVATPAEPPNMTISPADSVFATYPCLTEDESALHAANVVERLHADGRLGAYWAAWADGPDDDPPGRGILRADGSERPVAAVLRGHGREQREVLPARDMPMIASAYYYRTLPTSTRTVYEAFLGAIAERRARDAGRT